MSKAWYFKHDYSAKADQKVLELEMEFGEHIGYSLWFRLLEAMGEAGGTMPKKKLKLYSITMRIEYDLLERFISHCIEIGLLRETPDAYLNDRFVEEYGKIKHVSEQNAKNSSCRWNKENPPALQPDKQLVKEKPKKEPDHTQEIVDFWNAKADKGKCTKITGDIKKAIAKRLAEYSLDEIKGTISNYQAVVQDKTCFFSYVWNIYEFFKRDNAFLAFTGDESVLLRYQKNGNMQPPEPEPQVKAWVVPEWKSDNPKPDNYDNWDERKYNAYWIDCTKERTRIGTTNILEALKAKAEKEKQEAAEEAERIRWKHPFPKPEFWDGMKREAQEAYIRKHTDQEAAQ